MRYDLLFKPDHSRYAFRKYHEGQLLTCVFQGDLEGEEITNLRTAAQRIYDRHQNHRVAAPHNGRSMSVGDVVILHTPDGPFALACDPVGWSPAPGALVFLEDPV